MDLVFAPFEYGSSLQHQRMLFRDCFPETIGQPAEGNDHYRWKFHGFPAEPHSHEYAAWLGPELIGYYAAIPYRYRIGADIRTAGMVCDVMTGSRARGKGVFTRLGSYSLDRMKTAGLDFVTGYPIRPEVLPGHLKVGWKVVDRMPIYLKILKTRSLLRARKAGFLRLFGDWGAALYNFIPNRKSAPGYSAALASPGEFYEDAAYAPFLEQWAKHVPNALVKDRDFMKWRLAAPGTEYKIAVARDRWGAIVAVSIARPTALEKIPTLAVLDLMALPGHVPAIALLDCLLRRYAAASGSQAMAAMISPRWARAYGLRGLGYLRSPHVFSLIVKKLSDELDDDAVYRAERWHTMWIDSDDL